MTYGRPLSTGNGSPSTPSEMASTASVTHSPPLFSEQDYPQLSAVPNLQHAPSSPMFSPPLSASDSQPAPPGVSNTRRASHSEKEKEVKNEQDGRHVPFIVGSDDEDVGIGSNSSSESSPNRPLICSRCQSDIEKSDGLSSKKTMYPAGDKSSAKTLVKKPPVNAGKPYRLSARKKEAEDKSRNKRSQHLPQNKKYLEIPGQSTGQMQHRSSRDNNLKRSWSDSPKSRKDSNVNQYVRSKSDIHVDNNAKGRQDTKHNTRIPRGCTPVPLCDKGHTSSYHISHKREQQNNQVSPTTGGNVSRVGTVSEAGRTDDVPRMQLASPLSETSLSGRDSSCCQDDQQDDKKEQHITICEQRVSNSGQRSSPQRPPQHYRHGHKQCVGEYTSSHKRCKKAYHSQYSNHQLINNPPYEGPHDTANNHGQQFQSPRDHRGPRKHTPPYCSDPEAQSQSKGNRDSQFSFKVHGGNEKWRWKKHDGGKL